MKKYIPLILTVFSLFSCSNSSNSTYYRVKKIDSNTKIATSNEQDEKIDLFLGDSILNVTNMVDGNLIFSPISYFVSLATICGATKSDDSIDTFLAKTKINTKEEIKSYVQTIMTNTNLENIYDGNDIVTKEKISNLFVGNIEDLSKDEITSLTDDYYASIINKDDKTEENLKKWAEEETNGMMQGVKISKEYDSAFLSSLYFDSLYGMQLSETTGQFKNKNYKVMKGDSYTDYHILTEDYEAVSFELSGITGRGSFKVHFVKALNDNKIKSIVNKYSYKDLFYPKKNDSKVKYTISLPKNTQDSDINLSELAYKQGINMPRFFISKNEESLSSINDFKQRSKVVFDNYGIRCSSTSTNFSIPTEMAIFNFELDNEFAYVIEDPNGYSVYYGITTGLKQ